MTRPPRFVLVALAAAVLSAVLVVALAWQGHVESQRDCERAVGYRDDGRAMWLYLVDTNPGSDQARVDAFVAELNDRLPPLQCVDGNAVPAS